MLGNEHIPTSGCVPRCTVRTDHQQQYTAPTPPSLQSAHSCEVHTAAYMEENLLPTEPTALLAMLNSKPKSKEERATRNFVRRAFEQAGDKMQEDSTECSEMNITCKNVVMHVHVDIATEASKILSQTWPNGITIVGTRAG
eukprot:1631330-Rhodomonas_salina.1